MNKTKLNELLRELLLKNCLDDNGDLVINDIDLSDFEGNVILKGWKVGGNVDLSLWKVRGNLNQSCQDVNGDLFQVSQTAKNLFQDCQVVRGNLNQSCQDVNGDLFQNSQIVKGCLKQND